MISIPSLSSPAMGGSTWAIASQGRGPQSLNISCSASSPSLASPFRHGSSPIGGNGWCQSATSNDFMSRVSQSLSSSADAGGEERAAAVRGRVGRRAQVVMMPIGTPRVPYRTPGEGGWQWVDIWNVLYRERIIFIGQYLDEEFANQVVGTMLYLDSLDTSKPMYLYLNCPGGEMTPTMAIFDTMESISSPVGTLSLGYAYNNGGFLLAAGAKGQRVAMPMTRVALQSPAGAARGQADDIQNEAKELVRIRTYYYEQLAKKTGQPQEKIEKDLDRIKRFSAQEALEYGIIDRIVRPKRVKADAQAQNIVGAGMR